MILIFLSWLLLFYCFHNYGVAIGCLLKEKPSHISITFVIGAIIQTSLLTICAFFVRLGIEAFVANILIAAVLHYFFRTQVSKSLTQAAGALLSLNLISKITLLVIFLSALLRCAQSPFVLDNESYYVQTIKWLNEYGFVKGLANFNIAYGQTSPWHILQAGFNFSFLTSRINDLNGLLLLLCSFYFITEGERKYQLSKQIQWISLLPVFNLLLFQFIGAPSPDLPLILLGQMLFYYWVADIPQKDYRQFVPLLTLFLIFIKITFAPFGLLLLWMFFRKRISVSITVAASAIFGILWIAKNWILTGYPLYPFGFFVTGSDWQIPETLRLYINNMIRNHEYLGIPGYKTMNLFQRWELWLRFGGINSIFNKGILLLFLLAPFTKTIRGSKKHVLLYFVLLLHFVTVLIISPQFRFFLPEFIFLTAVIIAEVLNRFPVGVTAVRLLLLVAVLLPVIAIPFLDLKSLTTNKLNQEREPLSWSQLYLPKPNSRFSTVSFKKYEVGNLQFYSPEPNFFFYGTADGPLPATNYRIMRRFNRTYRFVPQLRGKDLSEGFYSVATDTITSSTLPK